MGLVWIRMIYVELYYPTCKQYEKKLLSHRRFSDLFAIDAFISI